MSKRIHLGHRGSRAQELLAFLTEVDARNIFVIGDLVDRARQGTRVVFVPGKHDEAAREFAGMNVCGIEICRQHIHVTADNRRLLLLHGDEFDAAVRCGRWRVLLGSVLYSVALRVNHLIYFASRAFGLREWSLTAWLKRRVSDARACIALFEESAAAAARCAGCHGVVCGHIHHAAVREIDGVLYCNDGDWVESCTSLVESMNGRLNLIYWAGMRDWARSAAKMRTEADLRRSRYASPLPARESAR